MKNQQDAPAGRPKVTAIHISMAAGSTPPVAGYEEAPLVKAVWRNEVGPAQLSQVPASALPRSREA